MVSQACGRVTAFGIWFDVKYEKYFAQFSYYKASTIVIFKSIVENISNFILVRKTLELQFTLLEAI